MTNPALAHRETLLRQHGNFALGYSITHQPGLSYFGDERGFIAYRKVGGSALALANPMAPPSMWPELVNAFVATMGDVSFWQVSRSMAVHLAEAGFNINPLGTETRLELETYTFSGPNKRNFRSAANRMAAAGLQTREMPASSVDAGQLEAISNAWRQLRTVKTRELTFLVRPLVFDDEKGVRKFFTFDAKQNPVAFAIFDPVYDQGTVTGYLMSAKRWLPQADPLVGYDLARCAIQTFQGENLASLFLGLSPFEAVKDNDFTHSRSVKMCQKFIRKNSIYNRFFYPITGVNKHKASYFGTREITYCAFNRRPGILRLIKLTRACGIF